MRPTRERAEKSIGIYFVSTQTVGRRPFFHHERWARLMIAVLEHYGERDFGLHAYVVMPDHLHLLIEPFSTIEKAVQVIKGGFSFRAKRGFNWKGEIWPSGFTEHRIRDEEDWNRHLEYMRLNPVKARLVDDSAHYPYVRFFMGESPQGLKPPTIVGSADVRAKARTFPNESFQGLKPQTLQGDADVRAEARTLPNESFPGLKPPTIVGGADVRAEARTLPHAEGGRQ